MGKSAVDNLISLGNAFNEKLLDGNLSGDKAEETMKEAKKELQEQGVPGALLDMPGLVIGGIGFLGIKIGEWSFKGARHADAKWLWNWYMNYNYKEPWKVSGELGGDNDSRYQDMVLNLNTISKIPKFKSKEGVDVSNFTLPFSQLQPGVAGHPSVGDALRRQVAEVKPPADRMEAVDTFARSWLNDQFQSVGLDFSLEEVTGNRMLPLYRWVYENTMNRMYHILSVGELEEAEAGENAFSDPVVWNPPPSMDDANYWATIYRKPLERTTAVEESIFDDLKEQVSKQSGFRNPLRIGGGGMMKRLGTSYPMFEKGISIDMAFLENPGDDLALDRIGEMVGLNTTDTEYKFDPARHEKLNEVFFGKVLQRIWTVNPQLAKQLGPLNENDQYPRLKTKYRPLHARTKIELIRRGMPAGDVVEGEAEAGAINAEIQSEDVEIAKLHTANVLLSTLYRLFLHRVNSAGALDDYHTRAKDERQSLGKIYETREYKEEPPESYAQKCTYLLPKNQRTKLDKMFKFSVAWDKDKNSYRESDRRDFVESIARDEDRTDDQSVMAGMKNLVKDMAEVHGYAEILPEVGPHRDELQGTINVMQERYQSAFWMLVDSKLQNSTTRIPAELAAVGITSWKQVVEIWISRYLNGASTVDKAKYGWLAPHQAILDPGIDDAVLFAQLSNVVFAKKSRGMGGMGMFGGSRASVGVGDMEFLQNVLTAVPGMEGRLLDQIRAMNIEADVTDMRADLNLLSSYGLNEEDEGVARRNLNGFLGRYAEYVSVLEAFQDVAIGRNRTVYKALLEQVGDLGKEVRLRLRPELAAAATARI